MNETMRVILMFCTDGSEVVDGSFIRYYGTVGSAVRHCENGGDEAFEGCRT
jgi:hypothetical protein